MKEHANVLASAAGSRFVIAGGCGGIGRDLVNTCVEAGFQVVVLDLPESIERSERNNAATYIAFDARDPGSIKQACASVSDKWDGLETFVFLSGFAILPKRPLEETSLEKWNELISVNLTSAYLLANELTPLLRKGRNPAIVTVASSLAYQVMPTMGAYATSKGGLVSLTKAIAVENAPTIRANVVAPGAVETEFLSGGTGRPDEGADRAWFDALKEKYVSSIPLARVAEPRDIVGPILFLAGPGSAYMTGQVLHLNGGRLTP